MTVWHPTPGQNQALDVMAVTLIFVAAVPANLFPIVYSRRPWRRSFIGRALMIKAAGMALLIDVTIAYYMFGDDYPYRNVVRVGIYSVIAFGIWLQFLALIFAETDRDLSDEHSKDVTP